MSSDPKSIPDEIKAMGVLGAKEDVTQLTYKVKPLAKTDADVVVTYNGICYSDVHMIDNDWNKSHYPLVPGHEVVGHVINVGSEVTNVKVGDVVGLGVFAQSCYECEYCQHGQDNLCKEIVYTYFDKTKDETGEHQSNGGFGSFIRTDARKLFKVPKNMDEKYVGPLLCAGITVYEPIEHFVKERGNDAVKKATVGVMGIGGLGSMAIPIAKKKGFGKVVALSRKPDKADFVKELGADELWTTTDEKAMKEADRSLDLLLVCIAGTKMDMKFLTSLMKPYGNLHFCGVPAEPITAGVSLFMSKRLTISANPVAGQAETQAMLDFCAANDIKPIIEVFPHSKAQEAIKKLREGNVRFRAVLKNDLI